MIKIALFDNNIYFGIGLQEALTQYFNARGKRTKFVKMQQFNEADLVFSYFPPGVPSYFCHLHNIGRRVLYFSLRTRKVHHFSSNTARCTLESSVIYHDMSLTTILHLISTELEREKTWVSKCSHRKNCVCQNNRLTPRENEVLQLILQEMTIKRIAQMLAISIKTVSNHKMSAMRKMGFRRDVELYNWLRYNSLGYGLFPFLKVFDTKSVRANDDL